MMDVCRQCNCSGVSGSGGGPVILRPLILVVSDSIVLMPVCFVGQIQTLIGVVRTSSMEMGVWMACG